MYVCMYVDHIAP